MHLRQSVSSVVTQLGDLGRTLLTKMAINSEKIVRK